MSLKNFRLSAGCPGPEIPRGGGPGLALLDPLDRIYEPSEDANWEEAFVDSIRPATASTPAPSTTWRGEDTRRNTKQQQEQHDKTIVMDASDNLPIELGETYEVQVPIVSTFQPLQGLWSSEFIACPSPQYRAVSLYQAEGREDPYRDEGIDEPSSPLSSSSQDPQPEEFIDRCDILQWVIDDSNITPNIFGPNLEAPSTITSGALQQPVALPTTLNFISPLKTDQLPVVLPHLSLPAPPSATVKSEPEDSDWEASSSSRKRGRPSKPLGSHTVTPRPSTSTELTDSEGASAQKYRRMRDLNNEASRRCRENRKTKQQLADIEVQMLEARNRELKSILAQHEAKVKKLKMMIMTEVRQSSVTASTAPTIQEPNLLEQLLQGASENLPDPNSTWPRM